MRTVKILSGVSGSGKSTLLLETILEYMKGLGMTATVSVCSADTFFEKDGVYNFDPSKLSDAHGKCFRDYITALTSNVELIVVDNTNTTTAEVSPYILGAQAYGYEAEIITVMCETDADIEACAARNSHGVSKDTVWAQHRRLCGRELMPWWKNTFRPVSQ